LNYNPPFAAFVSSFPKRPFHVSSLNLWRRVVEEFIVAQLFKKYICGLYGIQKYITLRFEVFAIVEFKLPLSLDIE
jgi:hypothetical protein